MATSPWLRAIFRHWLFIANTGAVLFLLLPFLAPALQWLGRPELANLIYAAYSVTCHEWPFRSYFVLGPQATYSLEELRVLGVLNVYDFRGSPELGYKVAFCARNVAIYAAVVAAGAAFALQRRTHQPLPLWAYLLLITPMAVDGFTQLSGWRESSWELRTVTGALFGLASVWLIYPRFDAAVQQLLRPTVARRTAQAPYS